MLKCGRCNKDFSDSDSASFNSEVASNTKCIDCSSRAKQPFLERFKTICKPERPVTRKEYRTLFTITLSLTLFLLAGSVSVFLFMATFLSSLGGQDPIDSLSENLVGILLTAAIPALLMFIAFGVATSLGIIKRSILEFTSLNQIQANIVALASIILLTVTGVIFIFAIMLGIGVSVRAIRRLKAESSAENL